jgi:DNA topoisomerase-3
MRSWKVDPEKLFDAQVERIQPDNGKSCIPEHLVSEAAQCHVVVLWLDCDREGENICYEVLENVLPNLVQHPRITAPPLPEFPPEETYRNDPRVWRVHFSSLAPADLAKAFSNLRKPNPWESRCVEARQEIDLKVGVALTRLITSSLRDSVTDLCPAREDGKGPMISYGPCQTPTLGFCVQRWDAIQRFNKETTFTINALVRAAGGGEAVTLQWVSPQAQEAASSGDAAWTGEGKGSWKGAWASDAWSADAWQSGVDSGVGAKGNAKGKKR